MTNNNPANIRLCCEEVYPFVEKLGISRVFDFLLGDLPEKIVECRLPRLFYPLLLGNFYLQLRITIFSRD